MSKYYSIDNKILIFLFYWNAHWNECESVSRPVRTMFVFSSSIMVDWTTAQSINSWHDHLCAMLSALPAAVALTLIWLIYFHVNVCYVVNYLAPANYANYATAWSRWNRTDNALNKSRQSGAAFDSLHYSEQHSRRFFNEIDWINKQTQMNCTHIAHAAETELTRR